MKTRSVESILAELKEYRARENARIKAGGCEHPKCPEQATRRIVDPAGNVSHSCQYHMDYVQPCDRVQIIPPKKLR